MTTYLHKVFSLTRLEEDQVFRRLIFSLGEVEWKEKIGISFSFSFLFKLIWEREKEKNISVREKHRSVASRIPPNQVSNPMYPDQKSNPWPFTLWEDTPTNWATPDELLFLFCSFFFDSQCWSYFTVRTFFCLFGTISIIHSVLISSSILCVLTQMRWQHYNRGNTISYSLYSHI